MWKQMQLFCYRCNNWLGSSQRLVSYVSFPKGKTIILLILMWISIERLNTPFFPWASRDTCSQAGSLDCTFMNTEQFVNYNQKFVGATCPEMTDGQLLPQTIFHPHASSKPVSLGHQQQCIQSNSSSWLLQSILVLVCYYLLGGRSAEMQGSVLCQQQTTNQ